MKIKLILPLLSSLFICFALVGCQPSGESTADNGIEESEQSISSEQGNKDVKEDKTSEVHRGPMKVTQELSRGEKIQVRRKNTYGKNKPTQVIPSEEKGERSRGTTCDLKLDNWTDTYVTCYADGEEIAMLPPYGNSLLTVEGEDVQVLAVAEFDDGTKHSWGPISKICADQEFRVELHDGHYNWYLE